MTYQPKTTAKMREELSQHMDYMERRYDLKTAKEYFDKLGYG